MSIVGPAAVLAVVLLVPLIAFQVALACGAAWGRAAYGGRYQRLPMRFRVTSAVAAPFWAVVALVLLRRAGFPVWQPLPDGAVPVAAWVVVVLFGSAVLLNAATPSRVERMIWLPTALGLLCCGLVLALS